MMFIKQLSRDDGDDIFYMLQRIGACENEFKNTAYGLTNEQFRDWLIQQDDWSKGKNLPYGYVAQTIYWLYDDAIPVGIGKIRHELNNCSRTLGGNIGYAIDSSQRGKGYATFLLHELVIEAKLLKVKEILLTVEKTNPSSKRVIEKNGGQLIKENDQRWFFEF